jgi:hypothetical protein
MSIRLAALSALLVLGACGSSPKTNFFTLDAVHAVSRAASAPGRAPIQVGHVDLPGTLDRQAMVTRGPGSQINVSDQDRWSAPLDELVRRAITEDLRQRLPAGRVLAPGDPTTKGTRTLMLNVQRFAADPSGQVVLEVDWGLQAPGQQAHVRHEAIRTTVNGQGGGAIADAMSRALGELADRIAATAAA